MKNFIHAAVQYFTRNKHLIQLPNGAWINPDHVVEVTTHGSIERQLDSTIIGVELDKAVYVNLAHNFVAVIECADSEAVRDDIAALINKER